MGSGSPLGANRWRLDGSSGGPVGGAGAGRLELAHATCPTAWLRDVDPSRQEFWSKPGTGPDSPPAVEPMAPTCAAGIVLAAPAGGLALTPLRPGASRKDSRSMSCRSEEHRRVIPDRPLKRSLRRKGFLSCGTRVPGVPHAHTGDGRAPGWIWAPLPQPPGSRGNGGEAPGHGRHVGSSPAGRLRGIAPGRIGRGIMARSSGVSMALSGCVPTHRDSAHRGETRVSHAVAGPCSEMPPSATRTSPTAPSSASRAAISATYTRFITTTQRLVCPRRVSGGSLRHPVPGT